MEMFNIISGVCSIVGLLVSVFTANKVFKITQTINISNVNDRSKKRSKVLKSTIYGDVAGGDIINETRYSK